MCLGFCAYWRAKQTGGLQRGQRHTLVNENGVPSKSELSPEQVCPREAPPTFCAPFGPVDSITLMRRGRSKVLRYRLSLGVVCGRVYRWALTSDDEREVR